MIYRGVCRNWDRSLAKAFLDSTETVQKEVCPICGQNSASANTSCDESAEVSSGDGGDVNSLAIVPEPEAEAATTSSVREPPESKPGWPLLHRRILSDRQSHDRSSVHQISVVQWAMQLPCRNLSISGDSEHQQNNGDQGQDQYLALDSKSGAIVPADAHIGTAVSSPEHNSRSIPRELEGLLEKYSSTCRLFKYQELVLATSNFLPGMFHDNTFTLIESMLSQSASS